jgi:hypothetical protein
MTKLLARSGIKNNYRPLRLGPLRIGGGGSFHPAVIRTLSRTANSLKG